MTHEDKHASSMATPAGWPEAKGVTEEDFQWQEGTEQDYAKPMLCKLV